jgi:ribosomal protein S27E
MNGDIWMEEGMDARGRVEMDDHSRGAENSHKILRGLKCKDCKEEIIYDYVENLYVCLGCGL